jgi:SAM-dependent methyltransferase
MRVFDSASSDFDRLGVHLWQPIGAATVEATAPGPGQRVLDACCGTGASALPAAHRVGPAGHVDAVDLSPRLVGELDRHAAALPQVHTHVADVTTWAAGGYDVVQCVLGVFFFPDMAAGAEHLIGRARPGGRVGVTIWRRDALAEAGRHLRKAVGEVTGTTPQGGLPALLETINEAGAFRDWLTARGLTGVTVTTHELRLPRTPEVAWLLVTGSGWIGLLAGLDERQIAAVRAAWLESLERAGVVLDASTLIGVGVRA